MPSAPLATQLTIAEIHPGDTLLDIGCGAGYHSDVFAQRGALVTKLDPHSPVADIRLAYERFETDEQFDIIWAAHVLEHSKNPGQFLDRVFSQLKDNGLFAVTVPPMKNEIVGGHVTLWNAGLLLYNLILAGFDCRDARVVRDGYNISVMVRKRAAVLPALNNDRGDIELLAEFFPFPVKQGFDGR